MKTVQIFLAAVLVVAAAVAFVAADDMGDPAVVKLTASDFDEQLEKYDLVLAEFYAPWCGHCKNLAPEFQKVAEHFNKDDSKVLIAKVDATAEKDLGARYKIEGFPTILLFKKGVDVAKSYSGERSASALIGWVEKQQGSAVEVVSSYDEFQSQLTGDFVVALGFFADESEASAYFQVAEQNRDKIKFLVAYGADWLDRFGVVEPAVLLFRSFDEPRLEFTGDISHQGEMNEFFAKYLVPMFGELTFENAGEYLGRNLPFVLLFVDKSQMDVVEQLRNTLKPVAADYRNKLSFVYLDNAKFGSHQERLGLEGKTPALAIDDYTKNLHYPFRGPIGQTTVEVFVKDYVEGKLEPHLRSEEPPQSNDGPVKVVVGKTFEEIVMDTSKDVLVEFYAPWCGHCKALAPTYDKVGAKFAEVDSVVIAKMDATANDPPQSVHIEGFPTILFFPANDKKNPVSYDGKRKVKSFVKFVQKNASIPFELQDESKSEDTKSASSDSSDAKHDEL